MKLLNKISIYNIIILFFLLAGGCIMAFFILKNRINHQTDHALVSKSLEIFSFIESNTDFHFIEKINNSHISIVEGKDSSYFHDEISHEENSTDFYNSVDHFYPHSDNCLWLNFSDTLAYHEIYHQKVNQRKLTSLWISKGRIYKIETYNVLLIPSEILKESFIIIGFPFLLAILIFITLNPIISKRIFKPFNRTLLFIKDFNIKKTDSKRLPALKIVEFHNLNQFINQMINKNKAYYENQKEFTENIAHEIQTPLMEAKGKMELLLESPKLQDKEFKQVNDSIEALSKLSKLTKALVILSKINNSEFQNRTLVNISKLMLDKLDDLSEIIKLKGIKLNHNIDNDIKIETDKSLIDILVTNLLRNSIDHNFDNGEIQITLTSRTLTISNTGLPLKCAPQEMFKRFSKNNYTRKSLGLGLAIVKKICDENGFDIEYLYNDSRHTLNIHF